jgi:hypothetical protein
LAVRGGVAKYTASCRFWMGNTHAIKLLSLEHDWPSYFANLLPRLMAPILISLRRKTSERQLRWKELGVWDHVSIAPKQGREFIS